MGPILQHLVSAMLRGGESWDNIRIVSSKLFLMIDIVSRSPCSALLPSNVFFISSTLYIFFMSVNGLRIYF